MAVKYTPRALQAVALARKQADFLGHRSIGTEHVLVGIFRLGEGLAVQVLQKAGLELEKAQDALGKGGEAKPDRILFTERLTGVLGKLSREAGATDSFVGVEHLLLGILGEKSGGAVRLARKLHIDPEWVRNEVLAGLDAYGPKMDRIRALLAEHHSEWLAGYRHARRGLGFRWQWVRSVRAEMTAPHTASKLVARCRMLALYARLANRNLVGLIVNSGTKKPMWRNARLIASLVLRPELFTIDIDSPRGLESPNVAEGDQDARELAHGEHPVWTHLLVIASGSIRAAGYVFVTNVAVRDRGEAIALIARIQEIWDVKEPIADTSGPQETETGPFTETLQPVESSDLAGAV